MPYALGDKGAMKFRLKPKTSLPDLDEKLTATPRAVAAAHLTATLATSAVSFDLQLQIKPVDGSLRE